MLKIACFALSFAMKWHQTNKPLQSLKGALMLLKQSYKVSITITQDEEPKMQNKLSFKSFIPVLSFITLLIFASVVIENFHNWSNYILSY